MAEQTKKLVIQSCTPVYTGQGTNGEYTIYEVKAADEQGHAIPHKLTSFSNFALGPGEFTVKPYVKNGMVESYTLGKPKGSGGSGANVQALKSDHDLLVARVEFLEGKIREWGPLVAGLQTMLHQQHQQRPAHAQQPEPPAGPPAVDPLTGVAPQQQRPFVDPGGGTNLDDIPF